MIVVSGPQVAVLRSVGGDMLHGDVGPDGIRSALEVVAGGKSVVEYDGLAGARGDRGKAGQVVQSLIVSPRQRTMSFSSSGARLFLPTPESELRVATLRCACCPGVPAADCLSRRQ